MEGYSLIDLLEEKDKDEELDDDELEIRKKRRLADLILNFITNKDSEDEHEEDILASLFEAPTTDQTQQIELLTDKVEPEVVARVVVETRINDLTQGLDDLDEEARDEQVDKIQDLQELRNYLMVVTPEVKVVTTEDIEIEEFVIIDEIKETTKSNVVENPPRPTQPNERLRHLVKREQPTRKQHVFESSNHTKPKPKQNIHRDPDFRSPVHERKPSMPTKSLAATRELLTKLYEKPKNVPIQSEYLERPKLPVVPKEQYHNYVNKNVPDIEGIKKLLQKNNFDISTQQKIISEILSGGDPETAIEKQIKNNEKTLGQTSTYIRRPPEYSHVTPQKTRDDLPKTKADIIKRPSKPLTSYPALWAIVIVIVLLLGIIFRVI